MKNYTVPFGWRRILHLIKESFFLTIKKATEYKSSFYLSIISNLVFIITQALFFFILFSNFKIINEWTFADYILFLVLTSLAARISGVLCWGNSISDTLVSGGFNQHLSRPLNIIAKYHLINMSYFAILTGAFNFLLLVIVLIYFQIELFNLILSTLLFFLLCFIYFLFFQFIDTMGFHKHYLERSFNFLWTLDSTFYSYPGNFFKKYFDSIFIFFFPTIFIGTLLMPLLRNYEIWNVTFQLTLLASLTIFLSSAIIFNWIVGLKKYEAFG